MAITDSEQALIPIRTDNWIPAFPGNTFVCGAVGNNLSSAITIDRLEGTGLHVLGNAIFPGSYIPIQVTVQDLTGNYPGTLEASWASGNAKIDFSVAVDVVDPSSLLVSWERSTQIGTVANFSSYSVLVSASDGSSSWLTPGSSCLFGRGGESTKVFFSLIDRPSDGPGLTAYGTSEDRSYVTSIETPLPEPPLESEMLIQEGNEECEGQSFAGEPEAHSLETTPAAEPELNGVTPGF